jgi:hypothetical protein
VIGKGMQYIEAIGKFILDVNIGKTGNFVSKIEPKTPSPSLLTHLAFLLILREAMSGQKNSNIFIQLIILETHLVSAIHVCNTIKFLIKP